MPNAAIAKPLEIFRAGTFTAMDGTKHTFTDQMLRDMVDGYKADLAQAPLVVGHPTLDAPAYGWVKGLALHNGIVTAEPEHVEAQFAGLVNDKRFPKISTSVFLPDAPGNPTPGKLYLKHVGFLGAAAPAVSGLKSAAFAGPTEGIAEFSCDQAVVGLFRGIRDFFISKFGLEAADNVIPSWQLDGMAADAVREDLSGDGSYNPGFSTTKTNNSPELDMNTLTPAQIAKDAELKDREAKLALQEAEGKKSARAASTASFAAFAETLITGGKLLPAQKVVVVEVLTLLQDGGQVASFAQGDENHGKTGAQLLQKLLESLPKQVEFKEIATGGPDAAATASFAAPPGFEVNAEGLAMHNKAQAYMKAHAGTDYIAALAAVGAK